MTPHVSDLACMEIFTVVNDHLCVGGTDVETLVTQAGGTPAFIYGRAMVDQRVDALRAHLPEDVHLHYAIKANPLPGLVEHLGRRVDGLDVASLSELKLALSTGIPARDISFAGPGKRDAELAAAISAGVILSVESENEFSRILTQADTLGITPQIALRVNPDFELKSSGMRMGGGARPFGIDAEQMPDLLREVAGSGAHFQGLQIFAGSQSLRAEALIATQDAIFDLAYRLADQAPGPLRLLNIGGGLGIPYFPGEQPVDLAAISENLHRRMAVCRERLPQARIILELGRYLVGEAGVYLTRIIDRKSSRGQVFLVTDGGMHHHLAASGNLGQVLRKNYPVAIATRMREPEAEIASVVGPLCTPLDILADRVELPVAQVGDLVAVFQSGAYGLSASPTGFLGHPHAREILI
ncbi:MULTISPECIES: pyridoxal-dependent decarboxylase, exosortase A system-associated [unclassified Halorhodospira]|uniref:pyridoxal-dependent decarboxylase, exosortase A system-associated n=1 Tax=unclassified Halorhodospira TaxID=2626748 RepID=UPI001EE94A88|nr:MULTISPECIES: pyridoxal-dependent decarboxylase, exosortase A system-associated [unclassified Halorhodospira]MCG5537281.1 pyridoxal-dependent decarboxylase, exosortase A system-associated [Halorhodospira sp. 9622]MCG5540155.1 pyridoxal-dependent decarboxylase, exosortase A system-associated [Halorhodospira sp. M39old]MCG5545144.1 pyridoxal-dependent decarboxylase, exosortase A system-associated [Halorhodospira sp. M38]